MGGEFHNANLDRKKTGKKLRYLMEKNDYTVETLTSILKLSKSAVQSHLSGRRVPGLETLRDMSVLYHVPMESLLVWKEEQYE